MATIQIYVSDLRMHWLLMYLYPDIQLPKSQVRECVIVEYVQALQPSGQAENHNHLVRSVNIVIIMSWLQTACT